MEFIKIPSGGYKKARAIGVLNELCFYYRCKVVVDQHGFIPKGKIVPTLKSLMLSDGAIWNHIRKAIECGFIKKNKQGYRLVSYDQVFSILGYDMTIVKGRKGTFKIHKVSVKHIDQIKSWIAFVDIRDNLKTQVINAWRNLKSDSRYQYTVPKTRIPLSHKKAILDDIAEDYVHMVKLNDQAIYTNQLQDDYGHEQTHFCNADITLSLKGIGKLLGLTNTSSAHKIVRSLIDLGLMTKRNRVIRIGATLLTRDQINTKTHYIELGAIFRRICNKIDVAV